MKKIAFLLITLIAVATTLGSVVIAYANSSSHMVAVAITPTSIISKPKQRIIVDKPATTAPKIKESVAAQGNSQVAEVALTFDDGPSVYTPQILNILQSDGVHATFFCIGEQIQYYPDYVKQEYNAGHAIGNHTWDHPDLTTLAPSDVQSELSKTSTLLQQTIGTAPTLFRPPYGAINANVKSQATQLGLTPILWSIDTQDWSRPGSDAIVNAALNKAGNGDIILMHDGGGDRSQTIAALPRIIQALQQRGLQLVTVPQLLHDLNGTAAA